MNYVLIEAIVRDNEGAELTSRPFAFVEIANITGIGRGYKIYSALLNQSDTIAPTATVLENTIGETFTFAYDDVGRFIITSPSNKFIANKTFMVNGNQIMMESVTGEISLSVANTSAIIIRTTEIGAGAAKNGVLINSPIEIRVYN